MKTSVPHYSFSIPLDMAARAVTVAGSSDKSDSHKLLTEVLSLFPAETRSRLALNQHPNTGVVILTVATGQGAVPDGQLEVTKSGCRDGVTLLLVQNELGLALAGKQAVDTVVGFNLDESGVANFAKVIAVDSDRDIGVGYAAYADPRMPKVTVVAYEFDGEHAPSVILADADSFQCLPTGMAVAHNNRLAFATGEQLKQLATGTSFAEIFAGQRTIEIGSESKLAAFPKQGGETDLVVIDRRNGIARFYSADASLTLRSEVEINALRSDATGQQIFAMYGQPDGSVVVAETDAEHAHLGQVMRLRRTDDIGTDDQQVAAEAK